MAETTYIEHDEPMLKPVARISWGGVIAGAIATIALGLVFMSLGTAIGLTGVNPFQGDWGTGPVASGIWSLLSIIAASFLGGLVGVKCSSLHVRRDAGYQGFLCWALAFLAMLAFAASLATRTAAAGSQLAGATLQAAGTAAGGMAPQPGMGQMMQNPQMMPQQMQQMMQQQLGGMMPPQPQLQAGAMQAAQTAANVGAAVSWWFFITALLGAIAGVLGGLAGLPAHLRRGRPLEVRRREPIGTPTETHA